MEYNAFNWYWFVSEDRTQAFSSLLNKFVPVTDETFVAWQGLPTVIDTMDNLRDVLALAKIPPYAPVTMWQGRKALRQAGLSDAVNSAVAAAAPEAQDAWQYADFLTRDNPIIATLGTQLGMDSTTIDHLFVLAAAL